MKLVSEVKVVFTQNFTDVQKKGVEAEFFKRYLEHITGEAC